MAPALRKKEEQLAALDDAEDFQGKLGALTKSLGEALDKAAELAREAGQLLAELFNEMASLSGEAYKATAAASAEAWLQRAKAATLEERTALARAVGAGLLAAQGLVVAEKLVTLRLEQERAAQQKRLAQVEAQREAQAHIQEEASYRLRIAELELTSFQEQCPMTLPSVVLSAAGDYYAERAARLLAQVWQLLGLYYPALVESPALCQSPQLFCFPNEATLTFWLKLLRGTWTSARNADLSVLSSFAPRDPAVAASSQGEATHLLRKIQSYSAPTHLPLLCLYGADGLRQLQGGIVLQLRPAKVPVNRAVDDLLGASGRAVDPVRIDDYAVTRLQWAGVRFSVRGAARQGPGEPAGPIVLHLRLEQLSGWLSLRQGGERRAISLAAQSAVLESNCFEPEVVQNWPLFGTYQLQAECSTIGIEPEGFTARLDFIAFGTDEHGDAVPLYGGTSGGSQEEDT